VPNRNKSPLPVIIAGGGIGGLAVALALSRAGVSVRVFEQADTFGEIGAGIQIGPNAFYLFEQLGITEQINAVAAFPDSLVVKDGLSGESILNVPVATTARKRFGYPYGLVHRADLHGVLLNACNASPLISLSASTKVTDFEDNGSHVLVRTDGGDKHDGAALVGADGLWSRIRERLVGDGKPHVSGHIAYRAVLPIASVPEADRNNDMTLWAGPKTHLVHYPLRRGELFNLVAVFHSDRYEEGWDTYGDPQELELRFRGTCPQVQNMLEMIESWRMWVLCDREPISEWSRGRVTLLGDAAHPTLQYMAQGACMAMEDGVCLANMVDASNGDYENAFVKYQKTRYLRTARVQLTSALYGHVYHAAGATRDLRNAYLAARTPEQYLESNAWLYAAEEVAKHTT
jgi:2-polyprenyl-6-methoxyphenol hydroxylase-like FAD-dependent oxidoreductase